MNGARPTRCDRLARTGPRIARFVSSKLITSIFALEARLPPDSAHRTRDTRHADRYGDGYRYPHTASVGCRAYEPDNMRHNCSTGLDLSLRQKLGVLAVRWRQQSSSRGAGSWK